MTPQRRSHSLRPTRLIDGVKHLRCKRKNHWLPVGAFRDLTNPASKCGKCSWCLECEREHSRNWYRGIYGPPRVLSDDPVNVKQRERRKDRAERERQWAERLAKFGKGAAA